MLATIAWLLVGQWHEWEEEEMGYSLLLPFLLVLAVALYLLAKGYAILRESNGPRRSC